VRQAASAQLTKKNGLNAELPADVGAMGRSSALGNAFFERSFGLEGVPIPDLA
jgi:hypothetical protein